MKKMELNKFINFLFLFILINEIQNECSKDEPIFYDNECRERYCSKEEFENGNCTINNNISKIQWLNKIDIFSKNKINGLVFIRMSNDDIFFICTEFDDENSINVNGLKSTGEKYFNDENEIGYKALNTIELGSLNGNKIKIEDKEYPLICSQTDCVLIDYESNNTYSTKIINFMKNINDEEILFNTPTNFPIINFNQENQILFITLFNMEGISFNFTLGTSKILGKDLSIPVNLENLENFNDGLNFKKNEAWNRLFCFMTEKKLIECFYNDNSNLYKVAIFEENLKYNKSLILDNQEIITLNEDDDDYSQTLNCIHLKKEIGVFIYFNTKEGFSKPLLFLQINELVLEGNNYIFKKVLKEDKIMLTLDNITLYDLNDISIDSLNVRNLIKINDNKFAYAYDYINEKDNYMFVLIIFDIYGTNFDNLIAKYYKFNPYLITGYFPTYIFQINIITYKSYIGIAFISFIDLPEEEDYDTQPYYFIFGNSEQNKRILKLNIKENW